VSIDASNALARFAGDWAQEPWARTVLGLLVLASSAWFANWIARRIVLNGMIRLLQRTPFEVGAGHIGSIVSRLSNVLPAIIVQGGIGTIPGLPPALPDLVHSICAAIIIVSLALSLTGVLTLANELYQRRPEAGNRPIKGYVQVAKLLVYGATAILVIAALMDQSPLLLLSGLGAMAAVLMLVFKDTILSLVASVQITSNDMIRVGDWIEMPKLDANGDVIDIALHTVKVQNFDKTITTIPTHRLITDSFRNWRGMSESGGRRIMRSLMIDQNSVRFLGDADIGRLSRFAVLRAYLDDRQGKVSAWNRRHADSDGLNARRLTNIGTFRAYVLAYLRSLPAIAEDKTMLVRQLEPGEHGLPLQIYAFASTTVWASYEDTQADIFDHLIAIMPEFGLRLFQRPTGLDLMGLVTHGSDVCSSGRPEAAVQQKDPVGA
jgi:miniconductance mechanosensitive channel